MSDRPERVPGSSGVPGPPAGHEDRSPRPDPFLASLLVAVLMVAGAFAGFYLAWRGAASTLAVPLQLPYLVSGGLGGLCLLIAGQALLHVQLRRRQHAREDRRLGELLAEAEAVLEALHTPPAATSARRPR